METRWRYYRFLSALLSAALFAACTRQVPLTSTPEPAATPSPGSAVEPTSVWIAPEVPDTLRRIAEASALPVAADRISANIQLARAESRAPATAEWVYALVAPFPTVRDGVGLAELRSVWSGASAGSIWVSPSTREAFAGDWGEPAATVTVREPAELLAQPWPVNTTWAIVPFEDLEPRWKVLAVDGQSPVRKDFDSRRYALRVGFALSGGSVAASRLSLPASNREASKLTTVIMTGTSGLVREIAYQMEVKGIAYPAQDIGAWLREADLLHISNEVSFDPSCPPPNPLKSKFSCSSPSYIALFDEIGLDVVELTGNHIMDHGAESMLYSLGMYREHGMSYFGGGANLEEARQPLLLERNGNRIAFLGCNFAEPPQPLATSRLPGANPCDWKLLTAQVRELRDQGYLPIATLQYKEGYSPVVMPWQSIDFRRAADAGAVIVSGSQSHVPMQMEFYGGAFIHFGLGNLFFGQMGNQPPGPGLALQPAQRYEFLDRHVFYDGRHISTELLTAMLEDYARPRPMTPAERSAILEAYFSYSGWMPFVPTPAPAVTPTLYPLLKFHALPTHTPSPTQIVAP